MTTKEIIRDFNHRPMEWCEKLSHETKIVYLEGEEKCLLTGDTTKILFFCLSTIKQILGDAFAEYLRQVISKETEKK